MSDCQLLNHFVAESPWEQAATRPSQATVSSTWEIIQNTAVNTKAPEARYPDSPKPHPWKTRFWVQNSGCRSSKSVHF